MTLEEHLDGLIERWERGIPLGPIPNTQIEARLAAAAVLAHLQAIAMPPAFDARLEGRIRARVRSLARQRGRGDPEAPSG